MHRSARFVGLLAITWCVAITATPAIGAIQSEPPIRLGHDAPRNLKTGEEADVTLRFHALADLDQLDVEVIPTSGLTVVSGAQKTTFTAVPRDAAPTVTLRVRLIDEKAGTLGVTFKTRTGKQERLGAAVVVCGDPRP
jgi:hypothetical protein